MSNIKSYARLVFAILVCIISLSILYSCSSSKETPVEVKKVTKEVFNIERSLHNYDKHPRIAHILYQWSLRYPKLMPVLYRIDYNVNKHWICFAYVIETLNTNSNYQGNNLLSGLSKIGNALTGLSAILDLSPVREALQEEATEATGWNIEVKVADSIKDAENVCHRY